MICCFDRDYNARSVNYLMEALIMWVSQPLDGLKGMDHRHKDLLETAVDLKLFRLKARRQA